MSITPNTFKAIAQATAQHQANKNPVGWTSVQQQTPKSYKDLITFVKDRPGHDVHHTINTRKIAKELNCTPQETFDSGMHKIVQWYLDNQDWCQHVQAASYLRERLGSEL